MLRSSFLSLALFIASQNCASIPEVLIRDGVGLLMDQEHRGTSRGIDARDVFKIVSPNGITDMLLGRIKRHDDSPGPLDLHSEYTLRLHNFDNTLRDLVILPRNFLLDLTNVKFNPSNDWGFHVGNWYVIRKMGNDGKSLLSRSTSTDNRRGPWMNSRFNEFDESDDGWFTHHDATVTPDVDNNNTDDDQREY
ncbi:hypothetical protein QAD02_001025 [Eretmocerus hayati]|uniref:Uncharacterized protein n=1 Tax=Eretmocerus hayati TaxID=131215 RepID=A0ACC2NFU1_9HYME|nr:hypothetical protein QAD02_001025 [Eretmocerus hayati]